MKIKNKSGLTLIESVFAVALTGTAAAVATQQLIKSGESNESKIKGKELSQLLSAFDNRIATDGYDVSKWTKTTWNNSNFNNDFTAKQLSSKTACSDSVWNPVNATAAKIKPVKCGGIWQVRPYGMDVKAKIETDSASLIDNFKITLQFKDDKHFEEDFKAVKNMLIAAKSTDRHEISGEHDYFYQDSAGHEITTSSCLRLKSGCEIAANFNRSGGSEYLRADGSNSLINDHLTFIEAKGTSPLKCVRWSQNKTTLAWNKSITEECGIGIYKKAGEALIVESVLDNGTYKNIMLDKECDILEWDGTSVVPTGDKSPCGMHNETEAYQVIENIQAKDGYVENFYAAEVNANLANLSDIISKKIKTKDLEVLETAIMKDIEAKTLTLTDKLNVTGLSTLGDVKAKDLESTTLKSGYTDLETLNVSLNTSLAGKLNVTGDTSVNKLTATDFAANKGVINNLNSTNLNSTNLTAANGVINKLNSSNATITTLKSTTINATTVNANAGNFTNVNNRFQAIENALNDLSSRVEPAGPDYAELESACNKAPSVYAYTVSAQSCSGGAIYWWDYYWNGSAKMCDKEKYVKTYLPQKSSNKTCSGGGR